MQLLTLQCLEARAPRCGGGPDLRRSGVGWAHFLSGQLLALPDIPAAGLAPDLNGTSRIVHSAVLRLVMLDAAIDEPAPAPQWRRADPPDQGRAGGPDRAADLAERLAHATVPPGGRVLGSMAWAMDCIVCNLTGRGVPPGGRRASPDCLDGNPGPDGWPQGFAFTACTGSTESCAMLDRLIDDAQRSFVPMVGRSMASLRLARQPAKRTDPGPVRVVLSLAGQFEPIADLQPSQNSAAQWRHLLRAERGR